MGARPQDVSTRGGKADWASVKVEQDPRQTDWRDESGGARRRPCLTVRSPEPGAAYPQLVVVRLPAGGVNLIGCGTSSFRLYFASEVASGAAFVNTAFTSVTAFGRSVFESA